MEFTKETAEQFVKDFLLKNGFTENCNNKFFKEECKITIKKDHYEVSHYDENFLEWMEWFSPNLTIYSLAGYLSWYDFIDRGYKK